MAIISLKKSMNIDFKYVPKHYASREQEKMAEVLMDPKADAPAIHYYMIRGHKNITIWEPGIVGGEYIKTYGHYHIGKLDETYWILMGKGIAILQKLAVDKNNNPIPDIVAEFKAFFVKQGETVYMPEGFGHLFVNISKEYFVTADDSPVNFEEVNPTSLPGHADYEMVKKMRGFAFYVIEHEGVPTLKRNPLYREIKKMEIGDLKIID